MRIDRFKLNIKKLVLPLITFALTSLSLVVGFVAVHNMPYPIPISTEKEFYTFTQKYHDGYFVLKNPITFTEPIKPIGDKDHPFKGMINGGSYNLNNVVVDVSDFDDSFVKDNNLYIALFPFNEGVIMNVNISGIVFRNLDNVDTEKYPNIICGGICGQNNGRVSNSSLFSSNIDFNCNLANLTFGSIVGENRCEIHKCKMFQNLMFHGNVESLVCGGIVGSNINGLVERCYRKGWIGLSNICGSNSIVGGICGHSISSNFSDCAFYDIFSGNNAGFNFYSFEMNSCTVGGIVGSTSSDSGASKISNCYSNPSIVIQDNPLITVGLVFGVSSGAVDVQNTVVSGRANIGSSGFHDLNDVGSGFGLTVSNSFLLRPLATNVPFNETLQQVFINDLSLSKLNWDESFWSITDKIECKL